MHPFVLLYQAERYYRGSARHGWSERNGHIPANLIRRSGSPPRIWVHAVSAGEVVAAVPILRELKSRLPDHDLVLSVITPAGKDIAEQQAAPYLSGLFYAPFDLFWIVRKVVRKINAEAFVSLESELWPNLLHTIKGSGAATVMVNGRMSERSYRRISRFGRPLFRWMLGNVDRLLVQSELDAQRFRALIPSSAADKVSVVGNSKFDQELTMLSGADVTTLRGSLHLPADAPVLVAGSTRSAEEEAIVFEAYRALLQEFPELCLIVAPRQLDRTGSLAAAMKAAGMEPVLRTSMPDSNVVARHVVLDTMGELANVYSAATIAFVGNSFEPVVKGGGQNLLQPLAHGKPVFVGPRTATIRSEVELAVECGVCFQVAGSQELARRAAELLRDPVRLKEIETCATRLIATNRGVSARYAESVVQACRDACVPPNMLPQEAN